MKAQTHKTCTRCHRTKPATAFPIKGLLPNGRTKRRGYCKACYNHARRTRAAKKGGGMVTRPDPTPQKGDNQ